MALTPTVLPGGAASGGQHAIPHSLLQLYQEADRFNSAIDDVWRTHSAVSAADPSRFGRDYALDLLSVASIMAELHYLSTHVANFSWRVAKISASENPKQSLLPDVNTDLYSFEIAL